MVQIRELTSPDIQHDIILQETRHSAQYTTALQPSSRHRRVEVSQQKHIKRQEKYEASLYGRKVILTDSSCVKVLQ